MADWEGLLRRGAFVNVMPHDYRRVLCEVAEQEALVAARAAESGGPTVVRPVGRPLDAAGAPQPEEALA
jgi:hypothetical protein